MNQTTHSNSGIPLSSLEAFENIKYEKKAHWKMIITAMKEIEIPVTTRQLGNYSRLPLNYHAVARRMKEMETEGIVKVVGRNTTIKNRPLLWVLTDFLK